MRVLVVTNDFPPRPGGIQTFVRSYLACLPAGEVVVYASTSRGAAAHDRTLPYPVHRRPTSVLLPTPSVLREARQVMRAEGCDTVWFGAAAPLGIMGPALRAAGARRAVGSTHGHETGWAMVPGAAYGLRRIGGGLDTLTYISRYTRDRLAAALRGAATLAPLPPGVDPDVFHPGSGGASIRRRHGLADRPVVACISRLVPRKGQDALIRAMPQIRRRVPEAALLVVGGGPYRSTLDRLVRDGGLDRDVVITGSVPWAELPAHHDAADVFAMPCRTRRGGLDVEGLGIVYLEASASGKPVVAGRSGGAPDAVLDGRTGHVVDGTDVAAVADAVVELLADPARAAEMGQAGRRWVSAEWRWSALARRLAGYLAGEAGRVAAAPQE